MTCKLLYHALNSASFTKNYLLLKSHRWYFIFEQVQYIIVLTIDFDSNLLEFLGDKYCDLTLSYGQDYFFP